jgi:type II secretory pathway predicted ATPase ExeA
MGLAPGHVYNAIRSLILGFDMRRPPNLMKTMTAPQPVQAQADPGPPSNYLDLYGLSKPPFGGAADTAGYVLFGSHRRAFELLVDHMMNGSGVVLLLGEEGIGKTETLRSAAAVAAESGLHTIMISRPPEGRISLEQVESALDEPPEYFHQSPRKALLADDIALMPNDCVSLLLSLARATPDGQGGSSIVLSSSSTDFSRPELAEFAGFARNTIRLPRLSNAEIRQYIERSLWIAGGTTRRLITLDAMKVVIARSGGVPGTVDRLMEAVLTAGFARGDAMITARTVASVMGPPAPRSRPRTREMPGVTARAMQIAALGMLAAGTAAFLYKGLTGLPEQSLPKAPVVAPPSSEQSPPAKPAAVLPVPLMAALMKRGNESLELGDIAAARLLFQRAADAGNAAAATALGKTYDPNFMKAASARDPERAAEWYQKAVALGDSSAADLLKRLDAR